jgi:hypothetical protein
MHKRFGADGSIFSLAAVQLTPVPLHNVRPGAVVFHTLLPIIMFLKALLTSLAIGVLSANALGVPLARSPTHEAPKDLKDHPGFDNREPSWAPTLSDSVDYLSSDALPSKREPAPEPNHPSDLENGNHQLPRRRDPSPEELMARFARDVDPADFCEFHGFDLVATSA